MKRVKTVETEGAERKSRGGKEWRRAENGGGGRWKYKVEKGSKQIGGL